MSKRINPRNEKIEDFLNRVGKNFPLKNFIRYLKDFSPEKQIYPVCYFLGYQKVGIAAIVYSKEDLLNFKKENSENDEFEYWLVRYADLEPILNNKEIEMDINIDEVKKSSTNRVVVLGYILGLLLLIYGGYLWLQAPFIAVDCTKENYTYAHKLPAKCSSSIIYSTETELNNKILQEIFYQNNKNKNYNRHNIAGHIALGRNYNYYNEHNLFFSFDLLQVLLMIGHYDEAENYIKSLHLEKTKLSEAKEHCYSKEYNYQFLLCMANSKARARDTAKFTSDIINYVIEKTKNDDIKLSKRCNSQNDKFCLAKKALEKNELDLAYKYINAYQLEKEHSNFYTIRFYLKLGMAYMDKQNYKKAVECFENVLEIQDYNYKAHEKLETCYRKLGNTKKADEHAKIMKELLAL